MRKLACFCIILILAGGCATTAKYEEKLNTWIGQSEDTLIASWGVPNKEYQLKDGKKALEFVRKNTVQTGGYMYTYPQTTYQSGNIGNETFSSTSTTYVRQTSPVEWHKYVCKTTFLLDKNGRIVSWHHEGNNCVSN